MTKNDKIQSGRHLFENVYISTHKKNKLKKYTNIYDISWQYYQGLLHRFI